MREVNLDQSNTIGVLCGLIAAFAWSFYVVYARIGAAQGLGPHDFAVLRFGVAGVAVLPFVAFGRFTHLRSLSWRQALILTLVGGPLFIGLGAGGFSFAPLAFGASLQPATVAIASLLAAVFFTNHRPGVGGVVGVLTICVGLGLLVSGTIGFGSQLVIGAAMFISAGLLWATFTALVAYWNVGALTATAVVSVSSALVTVPAYFAFMRQSNLFALLPIDLLLQAIVQGLVAGIVAVVAYSQAIRSLGPARASIFPALVPVGGILLGMPLTQEYPNVQQIIAALFIGMGIALVLSKRAPTNVRGPQVQL